MSVHTITGTKKGTTVRSGSAVPAYFLGRPRAAYEAAYATRTPDPVFARAA